MQSGLATKKYSLPLLTTDVFQIAGSLRERVRRLNVKDHLPELRSARYSDPVIVRWAREPVKGMHKSALVHD